MAGVTVAFDTLKAATRLQEEAGFDETKARVLVSTFAEGMVENLATKDDIAGLRREAQPLPPRKVSRPCAARCMRWVPACATKCIKWMPRCARSKPT